MNKILTNYSPYRSSLIRDRADQVKAQSMMLKTEMISVKFSPVTMAIVMLMMILGLSALYLWNFNRNSTKGYILKRLEISQQELQNQNDLKNLTLAKVKSMNTMIGEGALNGMRKPGKIDYIYGESVIAKAN